MNFPQISNKTAALTLACGIATAGLGYVAMSGDLGAVTSAASKVLLGFTETVPSEGWLGQHGYEDIIIHHGLLKPAMDIFSSLLGK